MTWDCIVVGTGLAGASTAYRLAKRGLQVLMLSKGHQFIDSNTRFAQGGIVYPWDEEDVQKLEQDVQKASAGSSNPDTAHFVGLHAKEAIDEVLISELKVPFLQNADGQIYRAKEAVHSAARIATVGDETGHAIIEAFSRFLQAQPNVSIELTCLVFDWARHEDGQICGVHALFPDGKRQVFLSPFVVVATGGLGTLFAYTSNPPAATGDGIALAVRGGLELKDMDYLQFHPTLLYEGDRTHTLLTEALRGAGAVFRNEAGEAFMEQYPQGSLAPRNLVSQRIRLEMERTQTYCVYLDVSPIPSDVLGKHFPRFLHLLRVKGLVHDAQQRPQEPIPVVPGFHFSCGGIATNIYGETSVPGIFAVGEVACTGLHGNNRLASMALLEALVMGIAAGDRIADTSGEVAVRSKGVIPYACSEGSASQVNWRFLKQAMWECAGVEWRDSQVATLYRDLKGMEGVPSHFVEYEWENALLAAQSILESRMQR